MSKKSIFLIGGVLCLLGAAWGYYWYQKPRADVESVQPAYTVTAQQLFTDFANDEKGATQKYSDKVIAVKGQVQDVQTIDSTVMVLLSAGNDAGGVNCSFFSKTQPATLSKGAWITVKGRCTGFLMDVSLVDAVLVNEP